MNDALPETQHSDDELAGLKQIARYLDVSVPTVRKYYRTGGLPLVERNGRYFAFTRELDRWKRASPEGHRTHETRTRRRPVGLEPLAAAMLVGFGALIVVLVGWTVLARPESPARLTIEESDLLAFADSGKELWRRTFVDLASPSSGQPQPMLYDVDQDGLTDVLVNHSSRYPESSNGRLVCLTHDGEIRWEFSYGREITTEQDFFEHTFVGLHLRLLETSSGTWILNIARHATWFPTQVVLLDPPTGDVVSEYWHPGHTETSEIADLDGDGTESLLLGGINNPGTGPGRASLVVLDLPFGPPRQGEQHFFGDRNARESDYLLFPRPDVFDTPPALVTVRNISGQSPNRFLVTVGAPGTILKYYLDAQLQVVDVKASDNFVMEHDRLFQEKLLDHRYSLEELLPLHHVLRLPTAVDGNSEEVRRGFQTVGHE